MTSSTWDRRWPACRRRLRRAVAAAAEAVAAAAVAAAASAVAAAAAAASATVAVSDHLIEDGWRDGCENTCPTYPDYADDGYGCDDGGPTSDFSLCGEVGTDCGDCGALHPAFDAAVAAAAAAVASGAVAAAVAAAVAPVVLDSALVPRRASRARGDGGVRIYCSGMWSGATSSRIRTALGEADSTLTIGSSTARRSGRKRLPRPSLVSSTWICTTALSYGSKGWWLASVRSCVVLVHVQLGILRHGYNQQRQPVQDSEHGQR